MIEQLKLHRFWIGLTNLVFGLVEILLALRFIFRLFAASSQAPFTGWLYQTTDIINSPFRGIFQSPVFKGQFVFETPTLVAMIVYALFFTLIIYLVDYLFGVKRTLPSR